MSPQRWLEVGVFLLMVGAWMWAIYAIGESVRVLVP